MSERLTKEQREKLRAYRERKAYNNMKAEQEGFLIGCFTFLLVVGALFWVIFFW